VAGVDDAELDAWLKMDKSERRQESARGPHPRDPLPVPLTYRQVTVIASLITSAADGHDLHEALNDIQAFLNLSAQEACIGHGTMQINGLSNASEAWARVEEWPFPPAGPPRLQPN
jgi:hypothetical protein